MVAKTKSQPSIISIKIVSSSRTDAGATVSKDFPLNLAWLQTPLNLRLLILSVIVLRNGHDHDRSGGHCIATRQLYPI
jgi:hypothetical protein